MSGYPDKAEDRAALRDKTKAELMERAEREASKIGHSIKCGNVFPYDEQYVKHHFESGGCMNDGRTCLCYCHDGQRHRDGAK